MASLRCANRPSAAARSFVQLASRSYSGAVSHSSVAPLEFLVPRGVPRATVTATATATINSPRLLTSSPCCAVSRRFQPSLLQRPSARSFSVSAPRRATVCVQNPQQDEDGNEMMLEITPRAAKRLSEIMAKDANPNLALRIQVESGGCHGFQYLMSLITIPAKDAQEWSSIVREDDTIFLFADTADGTPALANAPKIILDEPSLDLLKGSKVDFTMELIGSQFKITDNPLATSSCGCGTSFDIKM